MNLCPLCSSNEQKLFFINSKGQKFFKCSHCSLIHKAKDSFLDSNSEKERYLDHKYDYSEGYLASFSILISKIKNLPIRGRALDFGSGPASVISEKVEKLGFEVDRWDPFFAPDQKVWERSYDLVYANEVFEHLQCPGEEIKNISGIVRPGGFLVVATKFSDCHQRNFANWWYHRDPTHIVFYSASTMTWIGKLPGWSLYGVQEDLACFQRSGSTSKAP